MRVSGNWRIVFRFDDGDLLETGTVPFRKVGTHRRIRFDDLRTYKEAADDARRKALDELAADAQELDMGY